jgi:AcrR family transcriptional regulator
VSKERQAQSPAPTKLRADARRNREKLIGVAVVAFTERGADASLEDIARQAGVGIGTLYRHFPTREHLVEVVYRRELELIATAATELMAEKSPADALEEWMHRFVSYMAAKRGMSSSLKLLFTSNSTLFAEGSKLLHVAFGELLDTAVKDGSIKGDIEAADVLNALFGIYSIPDGPDWRERAHRLVRLVMDGLRLRA